MTGRPTTSPVAPWGLALAAMLSVQLGSALSVLTQHIGDQFTGIIGLSLTVPVAAATAAVAGVPQAAGHLSLQVLVVAAGLALLLPVLPYALGMLALRQMTPTAFGTLMALEPAIGVLLGLLLLSQQPSPVQLGGILLVVLAGAGAQRGDRRPAPATQAFESNHERTNLVATLTGTEPT